MRTAIFFLVLIGGIALFFLSDSQAEQSGGGIKSGLERFSDPILLKGEEVTAKLGLESRYRFELRDDFNLTDSRYEDDAVNLFRNRLSVDGLYRPEEGRQCACG